MQRLQKARLYRILYTPNSFVSKVYKNGKQASAQIDIFIYIYVYNNNKKKTQKGKKTKTKKFQKERHGLYDT